MELLGQLVELLGLVQLVVGRRWLEQLIVVVLVVRVGQAKCRRHATAKRRTQTERETAHRSLNPSARRALNWLSNVTTVVTVVTLGLYLVARPATRLAYAERSHLGTKAASTADSAPDLRGRRRPLLSRDSLTLLVVLGNTCHAC